MSFFTSNKKSVVASPCVFDSPKQVIVFPYPDELRKLSAPYVCFGPRCVRVFGGKKQQVPGELADYSNPLTVEVVEGNGNTKRFLKPTRVQIFGGVLRKMENKNDYVLGSDILGTTIPTVGQTYNDKATVEAVQKALKAKGFDPGKIDGIYGPNTAAAIRKMQKALGAEETGTIDYGVMMVLRINAPQTTQVAVSEPGASPAPAPAPGTSPSPSPQAKTPSMWTKKVVGPVTVWQIGAAALAAGVAGIVMLRK